MPASSPASPPAASPPASPSTNPINLLWSALGSSPIAALLYSLLRGEQTERRQTSQKMLDGLIADADHKAVLRERLKGQDEALARMADLLKSLDQRLASNPLPAPGGGRPGA